MEIDVSIERIENGYIVTNNDSSRQKVYFRNLVEFAECRILENLKEIQEQIRHHETPEMPFTFWLKSDL